MPPNRKKVIDPEIADDVAALQKIIDALQTGNPHPDAKFAAVAGRVFQLYRELRQPRKTELLIESCAAELAAKKRFTDRCNQVFRAGEKRYPDFKQRIDKLVTICDKDSITDIERYTELLSSIVALENEAPALLYTLGGNLALAKKLLWMDEREQLVELFRLLPPVKNDDVSLPEMANAAPQE